MKTRIEIKKELNLTEEQVEKIRLDTSTMGGGFGLTKAYFVCKQYQGRMWIASEPGKGTFIEIKIPGRTPPSHVHFVGS